MLHAGLDLSRRRLNVCLLTEHGELIDHISAPTDGEGLCGVARRVAPFGRPVRGVIERRTGHNLARGFRSSNVRVLSFGSIQRPSVDSTGVAPLGNS
jgi:hypothetical protein